ncbi:MAG: hypothetical protein ABEJ02_00690 [Candidatus Paceibacteria bacterium]
MNLTQRPDAGDISNFTGQVAGGAGVPQEGVPQMVGLVINVIFSIVGLIFLVLMVYGGIRWMTSRGNEDEVQAARNTVFRASIGLAIILAAYAIVNFFFGTL